MILFIHGFASCGLGFKSKTLIEHFGVTQMLTPDLPASPRAAIEYLQALQASRQIDLLIGSSLGGYYATYLNRAKPTPSVLINPATHPANLLSGHLGRHQRWCDGAEFDFNATHLAELAALRRDRLTDQERYLVLLQTGDEVLDYRQAVAFYTGHEVRLIEGGSHRFEHLERHLPEIEQFRLQADPYHAEPT
jgi:predicted esterase YcpF (UPF0227 family)